MRCVADESTGVKSCEMIGGLWRNDGGPLQCCEYEQNGTYFRASFGELTTNSDCDLDCFLEPNTETIQGIEYGVGNSCCPTTAYKLGLGICGRGCVSGELGIPARLSDGTVTCCSFEQHACWVDGLRPATGRMGTTCCDKEKHPYYNVISEQIECCDKTVMLVPETGGDMFHCCNADEEAYLVDANTPGCCKGNVSCTTHNGQQVCRCCDYGEELYSYSDGSSLACCTNNPNNSPFFKGYGEYFAGEEFGNVCCKSAKPVYDISTDNSGYYHYGCFEGSTQAVYYDGQMMLSYSHCPKGYGEWYLDPGYDERGGACSPTGHYPCQRDCL